MALNSTTFKPTIRAKTSDKNKKMMELLKQHKMFGRFLVYSNFMPEKGVCAFNFRWGKTKEGYNFWRDLYIKLNILLYGENKSYQNDRLERIIRRAARARENRLQAMARQRFDDFLI